jgi:hypothetical protein
MSSEGCPLSALSRWCLEFYGTKRKCGCGKTIYHAGVICHCLSCAEAGSMKLVTSILLTYKDTGKGEQCFSPCQSSDKTTINAGRSNIILPISTRRTFAATNPATTMRALTPSLTAALSVLSSTADVRPATKECKANSRPGADTLNYIIDPEYIIFPAEHPLSDLVSSINDAQATATDRPDTTIKQVSRLFREPCTLTIRMHSTPKISAQQLQNLIVTSMSNTDLFCHSASFKLHESYSNSHTMMNRNTTIHFEQHEIDIRDSPSVSYEVDCQRGQGTWIQKEDCSFCNIVQGELNGICQASKQQPSAQAAMREMAGDMGLGFGIAKCIRKNGVGCEGRRLSFVDYASM